MSERELTEKEPEQWQIDAWAEIGRFAIAERLLRLAVTTADATGFYRRGRFTLDDSRASLVRTSELVADLIDEYMDRVRRERR